MPDTKRVASPAMKAFMKVANSQGLQRQRIADINRHMAEGQTSATPKRKPDPGGTGAHRSTGQAKARPKKKDAVEITATSHPRRKEF